MKIIGARFILSSRDAEVDRTFLRDVLGLPNSKAGRGAMSLGPPPPDFAIHQGGKGQTQEFHLLVDDAEAFVAKMRRHGRPTAALTTQEYGLVTSLTLPSGYELAVCQPRLAQPDPLHFPRAAAWASAWRALSRMLDGRRA